MPNKIKKSQNETPSISQGRDSFQTPNYATELLIPFIPKEILRIWEPAAGKGKILNILLQYEYAVRSTDLLESPCCDKHNFLIGLEESYVGRKDIAIITNPPFSIKRKFYLKCREYNIPFALLVPCDYSGWIIEALKDGCEKIIPTRRIDYVTPSGLSGLTGNTSNFHSMWLTYGFGLGKSETFVELTQKMKENV